jgi:phage/plasmid-associated DNA primase
VDAAVAEYQEEQEGDVGQWLHEMCVEEVGTRTTRKYAYEAFKEWCGGEGVDPISTQEFTRELEDRGLNSSGKDRGVRMWIGFRFKNQAELDGNTSLGRGADGADDHQKSSSPYEK